MKSTVAVALVMVAFTQSGCAGLWAGAGAAGATAGYEAHNKRELNKLEDAYQRGEINQEEYGTRKDEIEDRSLVY